MIYLSRIFVTLCLLASCNTVFAQTSLNDQSRDSLIKKRSVVADLYFQNANPVGSNFASNGYSSSAGMGVRLQFYINKFVNFVDGIYIGGGLSNDYLRVKNTEAIGNYDRSTRANWFLYAGYDYAINHKFNVSADFGIGKTRHNNKQAPTQGNGTFKDTGNLIRFAITADMYLSPSYSLFLSPNIERVDYNISTPVAIQQDFNQAWFMNIAIGIRFKT